MGPTRKWLAVWIALCIGIAGAFAIQRLDRPARPIARALPQRIIPMAPNIAETVFALGAGERVVGVSSYTVWPPEAVAKPQVGALYDPDLEKIVALKPDLMIIQQKHEKIEALCRERGIDLLIVDMVSIQGILNGIRNIGDRIGTREQADKLADEVRADLDRVANRIKGLPRTKVFLCLGRTPGSLKGLFTVGGPSFLSELIGIAGGENIFADQGLDFPEISAESLIARAPDVIIETYPSETLSEKRMAQLKKDWQALPEIPAVRDGRIYFVTDDYILIPGPRIAKIAERFAGILHPEASDGR